MDRNKTISFLLAFVMILGIFVDPVFAITSNQNETKEVNYEMQEIDGKTYKVYKVSDLGLKNPEKLLTPKYRTRAAGDPMPDWVKLKLQSTTVGLTLGNDFDIEVYVALRKDDTKIASAKINPTEERVKDQIFHFVKTAEYDENNPDHQDPDKWYLYVESNFMYDIRLKYGERGNFGSESMLMIVSQRAMPLYKAVWFTNNQQRPVVDAIYNDGDNIANNVKLNTTDFAENEYKSFSSEKMPLYVAQKKVIVKDENLGEVDKDKFLVSDMEGAALWKLLIDQNGEKKTKGTIEDGATKYHFNITGDYKTPFVATMREELKVKFDPNGAKFDPAVKTEQAIGHSMKIGEEFGDLKAVTVPTKAQISNIPKKDNKDQELVGWVKDEANKDLDFSNGQNADKLVDPNGYVVKDNVTFYAVYAPVAQGKVAIQYVDESGTAIKDQYKVQDEDYPKFAEGNMGKDVDAKSIPEPKFIGYERSGDIVVTGKKYDENGRDTVEVPYKKLDSIIPEDNASEDVKKTYTPVTFAADTNKGNLKLGGADGGAKKVYYVNPVEGKTIENVRAKDNITAEGKKDVYKVDETTPWTFVPGEIDSLTTVITTQAVTVNANFVKEKGTVKYEYKYENKTSINDPSKNGIPSVPTDATEYDAETMVNAEATVAKGKTVPVKDNSGTTIGNWKFSGWTPETLKIAKGENKFIGTWTFTEAGKYDVTYKFASGTNGVTLPKAVTDKLTKQAESKYVGETVTAPTDTYDAVEVAGDKPGTWTFDGWYAGTTDAAKKGQALTVTEAGPNKFIGVWKFTEKGKKDVTFTFEFYKKAVAPNNVQPSNALGDFKPTLPDKQTGKYVGSDITLPTFENKEVNTGDLRGTWKFDGWYQNGTKVTSATVSPVDDNNKFVGKWILTETETAKVTRVFAIDTDIIGDGKAVPTGHELPAGVKVDQKVNETTNYVGSTQTPGKDNFTAVGETINGKFGLWTFKEWKPTSLTVQADASQNVFTGIWTWGAYEPKGKDINVTVGEKPNPQDGIKDPNLAPPGTIFEWKNGQPDTSKPGKTKVTILVKVPGTPKPIEVETNLIVTEEPVIPAPSITWKGYWYLGDSKTEPVQPKTDMEIGRHYKYLYGYVDKTVRPEGMITRSEAAALIARLANLDMTDKTKPNFKDTPSAWYNGAINAMVAKNLMFADKDGNFRPNEPITRGEFARALYYIDKKNDKVAPFADVKGHEFEDAINQAYGNGRIAGYQDGTFKPNANIQRAEAARILNQFADRNVTLAGMANVKNDLVRFTDINESHWAYCEVMEAANSHEYQRAKGTLAETWLKILDK